MRTLVASHPRYFEVSSLRLEFRYFFYFYKNYTNLVIIASAPALLHEVQLAQASIHVTCVCTYIGTMYISNLYMYQKSFEVPTMWSRARRRKYLFGTSGDACVIFREVWEMNITFCFNSLRAHFAARYFHVLTLLFSRPSSALTTIGFSGNWVLGRASAAESSPSMKFPVLFEMAMLVLGTYLRPLKNVFFSNKNRFSFSMC